MRVLMVEDEVQLAESVRRGLGNKGFEVEAVHDGLAGLEAARTGTWRAIVLDILLPGMNGYQVCRTLRAEGDWTPILMLTAKDGEYDEEEALDLGADDFLRKPFSFVVLTARLRALTRRHPTPRPPVQSFGDIVLDPLTGHCLRGDHEVALTPREQALLSVLLRHPDEVVRKDELLRSVWGHDHTGDANVVEVYMGYLRRKLDGPFSRSSLVTVRGVGYRLVDDA